MVKLIFTPMIILDSLCLSSIHQQVYKALNLQEIFNGSTGSRLISGTHALHIEVENQLAHFHNAESALLFNSGYDANLGLFSAILQKGDIVLFDELAHASIRDGLQMSLAKAYKFKHNDLEHLENLLEKFASKNQTIYISVESIYSMDGDKADLKSIVSLCKKHQAFLIVDEAHSNGVYGTKGNGLVCELGLEDFVFARVHTFGKALGCHGAVVLGSKELRAYLINFSRAFIYTTAIPLHSVLTIKYAYEELLNTKQIEQLKKNIQLFKNLILTHHLSDKFIPSDSAIHCCVISGNDSVKAASQTLNKKGFQIKPILSPTVKKGEERIRICLHSYNTETEITALVFSLKALIQ